VPPNIFPQQAYLTPALAMMGLLRRLVEVDGAFEIVEAYDANAAVDKRRTPTPGETYDFDNVAFSASAFGFQTGALEAGDWIVLRSTGAPHLQVYWELDSVTNWNWALISNDDFVTGGADVTPPVLPATAIGATMGAAPTFAVMALQNASMNYSLLSDNQTIVVFALDGTAANSRVMYVGAALSDVAGDTKPFIINDLPATALLPHSAARWNRLALDGATFLQSGIDLQPYVSNATNMATAAGRSGLAIPGPTQYWAIPAFIFFNEASYAHFLSLKWSYIAGADLATSGTLASLALVYFTTSAAGGRWALTWDGTTAV
jgi:hypothetical protein